MKYLTAAILWVGLMVCLLHDIYKYQIINAYMDGVIAGCDYTLARMDGKLGIKPDADKYWRQR